MHVIMTNGQLVTKIKRLEIHLSSYLDSQKGKMIIDMEIEIYQYEIF